MNKIKFDVIPGKTTLLWIEPVGVHDNILVLVRHKYKNQKDIITVTDDLLYRECVLRAEHYIGNCGDSIDVLLEAMDQDIDEDLAKILQRYSLDGEFMTEPKAGGILLNPMVFIVQDVMDYTTTSSLFKALSEEEAFDALNQEV